MNQTISTGKISKDDSPIQILRNSHESKEHEMVKNNLLCMRQGVQHEVLNSCVHYSKQSSCRVSKTHGKSLKNLSKGCAECCTGQNTLGNSLAGKRNIAECRNAGTSTDRLLTLSGKHSAKKRTSSRPSAAQQSSTLCRVSGRNTR